MASSPFNAAHRLYVKSLYKRMLKNEQDWVIRYDLFRPRALAIRAEFERNRCVVGPSPVSPAQTDIPLSRMHDRARCLLSGMSMTRELSPRSLRRRKEI